MNQLINKNIFKKDKEFYILASILPLFIVISMHKLLTMAGLLLSVVYFCYINIYMLKHKSNMIPKLIIMLLLMQNVGIGIGGHIGGNTSETLSLVTQIPSLFIVISAIFVLLRRNLVKTDFFFGAYVVLIIVFAFIGDGVLGVKAVYLRNFIIFYLAYIVGAYYLKDKSLRDNFISFVLKMAVCAGIFGIIGIIIGKPFYDIIGVNEVYIAKKSASFKNGLPGNFITLFGSKWVNRLASFYYEPVNFSYFMSFAVILAATSKKIKIFIFLFICEILTFGKGGILVMAASAACVTVHVIIKKLLPKWSLRTVKNFILAGMTGGVTLFGIIFYFFLTDIFGGYIHFYGIITGIQAILKWPLGHGLGTAGNMVRQFDGVGTFDISETGFVNMGYQIGIIGIFMFVIVLFLLSNNAYRHYKKNIETETDTGYLGMLCIYMPIILMMVFVFQENTFTPQCIAPYMLIQGSYIQENNQPAKSSFMRWMSVVLDKLNKIKPQLKEAI